ncbi:hypothetical protein AGMMS50262_10890 [Bacteroidia bacterium]|nr:hypothetical protein AGMMS50262_10890 [Bacteroidia bacterium]
MKKIIFILLVFQSLTVCAQWSDDFSDGVFTSENRAVKWTGDVTEFTVNTAKQLQLYSADVHSPAQLRTASTKSVNTQWEFYVKLGFNSSSNNYVKVYLMSDREDLTGALNGIFVRVGHTNDNVCLVRATADGGEQILIEGEKKRLDKSTVGLKVMVTLDVSGSFKLYSCPDDFSGFVLEGSSNTTVSQLPQAHFFGVVCTFTSSNKAKIWFDDFVVKDFDGDDPGTDPGTDPEPTIDFPQEGDILFSEIMANPGTGSENPEYVELYNATDKTFSLKDCVFFYGDKPYTLPDKILPPKSYFVLCKTTAVDWFGENVTACGVTSFPALANTGKLLMLGNTRNELLSWFEYSDKMYGDNTKKAGGWSLECIDLKNLSNTAENWLASTDSSGGTPGKVNSIQASHLDTTLPAILSSALTDNNQVQISFSKPMDRKKLLDVQSYRIENASYAVTHAETNYPQGTELTLQLNQFPPRGELIELNLSGLKDLSGNGLGGNASIAIGNAFEADSLDLIINELLFNPPTGGNEYVEIYNRSGKVLDLRYLSITSRKPSDGSFNKAYPLTTLPLFLQPGEYGVIAKSRELVCNFFGCQEESFFTEPEGMPSIANTSGCVVILNNITNGIIDQFYYNENMHSKGISTKKGVALERVRFEAGTDRPENWLSATTQSGYGTPGYVNSQHQDGVSIPAISDNFLRIEYPSVVGGDYRIHYQLDQAGYNCRLFIYDTLGRMVSSLINNELLNAQGTISWNGQSDTSRKLTSGVYVIFMEVFNTDGIIHHLKTPVVVK